MKRFLASGLSALSIALLLSVSGVSAHNPTQEPTWTPTATETEEYPTATPTSTYESPTPTVSPTVAPSASTTASPSAAPSFTASPSTTPSSSASPPIQTPSVRLTPPPTDTESDKAVTTFANVGTIFLIVSGIVLLVILIFAIAMVRSIKNHPLLK